MIKNAVFNASLRATIKEKLLEHGLNTRGIRRLPTALTAPPPRPKAMPTQEIAIWTARKALVAMFRTLGASLGVAVRDTRVPRRT